MCSSGEEDDDILEVDEHKIDNGEREAQLLELVDENENIGLERRTTCCSC